MMPSSNLKMPSSNLNYVYVDTAYRCEAECTNVATFLIAIKEGKQTITMYLCKKHAKAQVNSLIKDEDFKSFSVFILV